MWLTELGTGCSPADHPVAPLMIGLSIIRFRRPTSLRWSCGLDLHQMLQRSAQRFRQSLALGHRPAVQRGIEQLTRGSLVVMSSSSPGAEFRRVNELRSDPCSRCTPDSGRGVGFVPRWRRTPFSEEVQHRGADTARDLGPTGMPGLSCASRGPGGAQAMALQARP
jgi:hypothetical protein